MKGTSIIDAYYLVATGNDNQSETDYGWVAARPLGMSGLLWRLRCAWIVFTGKADALVWKGQ